MLVLIGNLWIASIWAHEIVSNVIRLGEFSPSAWGVLSVLKKIIAMSWYEVALLLEANFFVRRKIIARVYFWWGVKTRNTWGKKNQLRLSPYKITEVGGVNSSLTTGLVVREHPGMHPPIIFQLFIRASCCNVIRVYCISWKKKLAFFQTFASSLRWTLTAVRQCFS